MKAVNQPIRKKDAMALVTGKPVFMDDLVPKDCLIVKLLRSPHANAIIKEINKTAAEKVPGIEAIYTWEDVPQQRFTTAGQTYPEATPYDRLILDRHVRFVGDPVAIIAGEDEACVEKAMRLIKVKYEVLPAILDFHVAKDNEILIHPEDNWRSLCPVGADNKRNLCATARSEEGDVDGVMAECDTIVEHTYHTVADQQAMMETFRTYCSVDAYGRLNIFSSTQIVFHVRRIVSNALGIPKSQIRVSKPRVGGGFGAKQTAVSEVYPAFVTWMTKKPSKIIFTREESQIASSPRHEMEVHVKVGAMKDGTIRAIDMYTLSNTGAYGEHGPTTVGLSGHKSIPLYAKAEAFRFDYDVVYTNVMSAGAYRGYGATQGIYAPGSTFKMVTAVAALESGIITPSSIIQDRVIYTYYKDPQPMCWIYSQTGSTHGRINVSQAITDSCNYFFYEVGRLTGIRTLDSYASQFGLGQSTGIEIGDSSGVLASPEWAESHDQEWTDGQTITAAIGQSYNLFSPLQLANYVATLVSGGDHYDAHLLKSAKAYDNSSVVYAYNKGPSNHVDMADSTLEAVKSGARGLATGSLSYVFNSCIVPVGCKTGTAETGGELSNGCFVAFAPYDDPQIAVCVVIEQGGGGSNLAPIARDIINAYFSSASADTTISGENTLIQ